VNEQNEKVGTLASFAWNYLCFISVYDHQEQEKEMKHIQAALEDIQETGEMNGQSSSLSLEKIPL